MALTLVSCKIPAAETPVVGVTLDPYVLVRRGDSGVTATAEEVPEEGHSDARFSLRFRYRTVFDCPLHPCILLSQISDATSLLSSYAVNY